MDLERFVANRELLERLSREYELLKASGGKSNVDYAAWVRQRLREAAAELAAATVGTEASSSNNQDGDSSGGPIGGATPPSAHEQPQGAVAEASMPIPPTAEQLAFTRRPGPMTFGLAPRPPLESAAAAAASNVRPESAWFLQGEGTGPTSEALATAIYGLSAPGTTGFPAPAPAATGGAKAISRKTKRVVILSPRKSPPPQVTQPRSSPARQSAAAAPPVSKLYTRVEPGLFSTRPDAYIHPQARERRAQPLAATRPDWVNAASLQAALRGASSAVPHLQAAAERERRLALSTALARQTLAAGLGADEARAVALYGVSPAATAAASSQAAQYDHVLLVAQQLAAQNEQLAMAVQLNSAQLAQQQALLDSALQQQHIDQTAPEGGGAAAGAAAGGPVVEVESGPPPWFLRRAPPGPGTTGGKRVHGTGLTSRPARGTATTTTITATTIATKSPPKKTSAAATTRARSPPPPHHNPATLLTFVKPTGALVAGPAATAGTAKAAAATTAKERDRSSRREALKALLKQVLGGAGLAGGQEGRRRLASSMAEAEKLVEAIQALARKKAQGRDGGGAGMDGQALGPVRAAVAVETQTSGRASGSGGGAAAAAEAAAAAGGAPVGNVAWNPTTESRQPSRAASVAHSRSAASAAGGASSRGGASPGPSSSRALSQGSGPGSGLSDGEAAGVLPRSPKAASRAESAGPSRYTSPPGSAKERTTASPPSSARGTAVRTASLASSAAGGSAVAPAAAYVGAGGSGPGHAAQQAHAASAAAAALRAAARPPPPGGLLVESLQDQVQQIVERDAAAAAEMARLQKLDALEQRLHSMVNRVETKLERVLQPLQLNAQQQLLGPAAAAALEALHIGPDGQPQRSGAAAAATADAVAAAAAAAGGEPSIAALAAAIVTAAASGAGTEAGGAARERYTGRGGSGGGGGSGYSGAAGVDVASPRSAGLSVLELQRMLIQINRMESKEQEVRRKWFHDARGPRQRGRVGQPIVVREGQLGTLLDPRQPPSPRTASSRSCSRSRSTSPHASGRVAPWSPFPPRSPTLSVLATVAADDSALARTRGSPRCADPGSARKTARFRESHDGTAGWAGAEDLAAADPISNDTLESVLRGRRRFMRAQQLADGDLVAASQPSLNPVQVMEDLTDALLEEVLHEQAQELAGFCDSLGEHLFLDEFDLPDDDEDDDLDGRR
ncbi:hypothetical protein PLESTF_000033600 [Pleodorina starrii]|nr:hypothetical protein PLESTF_000033600 [Pleodorina starrii]